MTRRCHHRLWSSRRVRCLSARARTPPGRRPRTTAASTTPIPTNWPNDPGYAGDWKYWSFVPHAVLQARSTTSPSALGTGAHVDRAWAKTTGDPRVLIAVTDSGIEWYEGDLVNKLFLNAGELPPPMGCPGSDGIDVRRQRRRPLQRAGLHDRDRPRRCPRSPRCATRASARTSTTTASSTPQDLIAAFSDGKDDDGNGYIDDISGWDFFHNDNDPARRHRASATAPAGAATASPRATTAWATSASAPTARCVMLRVGDASCPRTQHVGDGGRLRVDIGAQRDQHLGRRRLVEPAVLARRDRLRVRQQRHHHRVELGPRLVPPQLPQHQQPHHLGARHHATTPTR